MFEFRFFFDMEARADDPDIRRLLSEIEGLCTRFAFLGCYEEQTA